MVEYIMAKGITPDRDLNHEKMMHLTPISGKNLRSFTGNYAMPGMVCSIDWKNDHLSPTIEGQNFYLVQHDSNSFVPAKRFMGLMLRSRKMYLLLEEIDGEKLLIQAMPWGGLTIIGTQTTPEPIPVSWKNRTGDYAVVSAGVDEIPTLENASISIENGFVVLRYGFNPALTFGRDATVALDIAGDNEAFVLGYGRGGGEAVIFEPGKNCFEFMGLRFEKI